MEMVMEMEAVMLTVVVMGIPPINFYRLVNSWFTGQQELKPACVMAATVPYRPNTIILPITIPLPIPLSQVKKCVKKVFLITQLRGKDVSQIETITTKESTLL